VSEGEGSGERVKVAGFLWRLGVCGAFGLSCRYSKLEKYEISPSLACGYEGGVGGGRVELETSASELAYVNSSLASPGAGAKKSKSNKGSGESTSSSGSCIIICDPSRDSVPLVVMVQSEKWLFRVGREAGFEAVSSWSEVTLSTRNRGATVVRRERVYS
jgi:hypothetical protein